MSLNEADTRAKLIDPALHSSGWGEDLIKREETAGAIEIINGTPKRIAGKTDYTLRVKISSFQPIAVGIVEAKSEKYPPTHGLQQAKIYASAKRLNVPFVFSSNGHFFLLGLFFGGEDFVTHFLTCLRTPPKKITLDTTSCPLGANMSDFGAQLGLQNRHKIGTFSGSKGNLC